MSEQQRQEGLPPVPSPRAAPGRKLSRRTLIAGLATLTGVSVVGGGTWWAIMPHPLYTYRGHSGSVRAIAWSPDGKYIASGSDDHTVQVWDVK